MVRRAIATLPEKERVKAGADLVNTLITQLANHLPVLQAKQDSVATYPAPHILTSLVPSVPKGQAEATTGINGYTGTRGRCECHRSI